MIHWLSNSPDVCWILIVMPDGWCHVTSENIFLTSFNKCTAQQALRVDASVTLGVRHRLKRWPSILWCLCTHCTSKPLRPALLRTKGRQSWLIHMPVFSDIDLSSITWLSYHLEKSRWSYRSCQTLLSLLSIFQTLAQLIIHNALG